jgi:DNA-binding GntR family transcriptional regulator
MRRVAEGFEEIANTLRDRIRGMPAGSPVPSESQLSAEFRAARMTVRAAVRVLIDEGLVVEEHGRGVFVTDWSWHDTLSDGEQRAMADLGVRPGPRFPASMVLEAYRLGLRDGVWERSEQP